MVLQKNCPIFKECNRAFGAPLADCGVNKYTDCEIYQNYLFLLQQKDKKEE